MDVKDTQTTLAAVAGDGAAGIGVIDMFKLHTLADGAVNRFADHLRHRRMGDENALRKDVRRVPQTVAHVILHTLDVIAAVFFRHNHLIVHHFDAGLEL